MINKCNIKTLPEIFKEAKYVHLKASDILFKVHAFEIFGK